MATESNMICSKPLRTREPSPPTCRTASAFVNTARGKPSSTQQTQYAVLSYPPTHREAYCLSDMFEAAEMRVAAKTTTRGNVDDLNSCSSFPLG